MAVNFTVEDFSNKNYLGEYTEYALDKECAIFGKLSFEGSLKISINNKCSLKSSIQKINEYLNWLAGRGKDELIGYFNENMKTEKMANDQWYDQLFMYKVNIIVVEDGRIGAQISCDDNYHDELGNPILHIDLFENNIRLMEY